MKEAQLDKNPPEDKDKSNLNILVGALFALTLLFLYQQVFSLNFLLVYRYFDKGIVTFALKHLIPILTVVLFGLLFLKQLKNKHGLRMVKIFIAWICSLFIYYILFHFGLRLLMKSLLYNNYVTDFKAYQLREPEFLTTYVEPLFYPITLAVIIYLLLIASRTQSTKEI